VSGSAQIVTRRHPLAEQKGDLSRRALCCVGAAASPRSSRKLGSCVRQGGSFRCPCSSSVGLFDPTGWRRSKAAEAAPRSQHDEHSRHDHGHHHDHGRDTAKTTESQPRLQNPAEKHPSGPSGDRRLHVACSLQAEGPLWLRKIFRIFLGGTNQLCRPVCFRAQRHLLVKGKVSGACVPPGRFKGVSFDRRQAELPGEAAKKPGWLLHRQKNLDHHGPNCVSKLQSGVFQGRPGQGIRLNFKAPPILFLPIFASGFPDSSLGGRSKKRGKKRGGFGAGFSNSSPRGGWGGPTPPPQVPRGPHLFSRKLA